MVAMHRRNGELGRGGKWLLIGKHTIEERNSKNNIEYIRVTTDVCRIMKDFGWCYCFLQDCTLFNFR